MNGNNNESEQSKIKINEFVFQDGPSAYRGFIWRPNRCSICWTKSGNNGYIASGGKDGLQIISGAASGGASFVVRNDAGINL